jgi:hypothetical protein
MHRESHIQLNRKAYLKTHDQVAQLNPLEIHGSKDADPIHNQFMGHSLI